MDEFTKEQLAQIGQGIVLGPLTEEHLAQVNEINKGIKNGLHSDLVTQMLEVTHKVKTNVEPSTNIFLINLFIKRKSSRIFQAAIGMFVVDGVSDNHLQTLTTALENKGFKPEILPMCQFAEFLLKTGRAARPPEESQ